MKRFSTIGSSSAQMEKPCAASQLRMALLVHLRISPGRNAIRLTAFEEKDLPLSSTIQSLTGLSVKLSSIAHDSSRTSGNLTCTIQILSGISGKGVSPLSKYKTANGKAQRSCQLRGAPFQALAHFARSEMQSIITVLKRELIPLSSTIQSLTRLSVKLSSIAHDSSRTSGNLTRTIRILSGTRNILAYKKESPAIHWMAGDRG